jgi:hypothetical protein
MVQHLSSKTNLLYSYPIPSCSSSSEGDKGMGKGKFVPVYTMKTCRGHRWYHCVAWDVYLPLDYIKTVLMQERQWNKWNTLNWEEFDTLAFNELKKYTWQWGYIIHSRYFYEVTSHSLYFCDVTWQSRPVVPKGGGGITEVGANRYERLKEALLSSQ